MKASLLATFKRFRGKEQVMYNHHALYTHKGQGAASGAGVAADGGIWYLSRRLVAVSRRPPVAIDDARRSAGLRR